MFEIISWYLAITILGWLTMPIGMYLFKSFKDYGYPFHKIIGLGLVSYLAWLLGSLHLVKFNIFSILISLAIVTAISAYYYKKIKQNINMSFAKKVIIYELIFAVLFAILAYYKSFFPDIQSIEKIADYHFLTSVLYTDYFPPNDTWLNGFTVNYYYFGYVVTAALIKMSNVAPPIGFNLMQAATIIPIFGLAIFSLGYNITGKYRYSSIFMFVSVFVGNVALFFINNSSNMASWWNSTRIITPDLATEFPLASLAIGDLHPHFMDLPFVICFLTLLYVFYINNDRRKIVTISIAANLSIILAINSWDAVIYGTMFVAFGLSKYLTKTKIPMRNFMTIAALSLLLSIPFILTFRPPTSGIGILLTKKTTMYELLNIYLLPFAIIAGYLGRQIYRTNISRGKTLVLLLISISLFAALLPLSQVLAFIMLFVPSLIVVIKYNHKNITKHLIYADTLILVAFLFMILCEFFYIDDIYGGDIQRFNTVFKVHYQIWVILGVASSILIYELLSIRNLKKTLIAIPITILILASFYHIPQMLQSATTYSVSQKSLDGSRFLETVDKDRYESIRWFSDNIGNRKAVVAEKAGASFSNDSTFSAFTGNPTIVGWSFHELVWRGESISQKLSATDKDLQTLYESSNVDDVKAVVLRYDISYILVSRYETKQYNTSGSVIPKIYSILHKNGSAIIYKTGL